MRFGSIIVCLGLLLVPAGAGAAKYAGEFMALGGGARAMGMGGAFTAVASDATADFWNPAGIAAIGSFSGNPAAWQMILMHSERFGDLIDYNFFAAAFPLRSGESAWGISLIHLGVPDIPIYPWADGMIGNSDGDQIWERELSEYLNFDYRNPRLESANDYALLLSYAQVMSFGNAGASVKLIRNDQVTGVSSFGVGIDLGFLRRGVYRDLAVGVKLQDATGTYIGWSTGHREFIYPCLRIGLAYPIAVNRMGSTVLLAVDGDLRYENRQGAAQFWVGRASADIRVGAEVLVRELVALRGGLEAGRPTAGVGLVVNNFSAWNVSVGIDYAMLAHDVFDTTHRVSLMVAH